MFGEAVSKMFLKKNGTIIMENMKTRELKRKFQNFYNRNFLKVNRKRYR